MGFQSTPDYLNRENGAYAECETCEFLFQSTPDYLNRENVERRYSREPLESFNPLPII